MKLLSIGNSFSQDAQEWLHQIAVANGVDLETTNLMIGGCSLETHWSHVVDQQAEYYLEQNGKNMNRMVTIDEGLALDEWDVITVQQASHYSGQPQTYVPFLTDLVAHVREKCPKAQIYFHQTWAYEIDSDHGGFLTYNRDQQEMYRRIGDCAAMAQRLIGATLLPSGPVVQYLRENTPEFDYKNGGLSLNRDGFHLSWDYGRYAAAATWYKVLTGKTPAVNAFPEWDAHLIDVIHDGINAVVGE
ncbi:MAG: DUF4886 domain-containing protein [Ruminococcaceae bacterium]|nr:DUF4886 domain-containing protein [Oscillospiraceae bacterium]